ncbi:MAG: hypothetical protein KKE51_16495 [Gammaproteobacteria bacterium]|nr:hypothetical protein [Gammaproteobacteria bacterium]MBU1601138.1 hypothetical protein [Gammaproteobacteria bacterium]MBU2434497.1 hypothetical protein [Gammaproteobacteria bacterium]MBU2450901.1 hypothetical protein [Gammaproteobacteria bacterium]
MTLSGRDLKKLWLPLLATLAMISVAGLLGWASTLEKSKAEQERNTALSARDQIDQRLRQVRTEEQEIRERTALLQQLKNAGITGPERRLDWMEQLRDTQRELRIPGMKYEFGAQTSLENGNDPSYTWFASPLHLQLRLLHEEDLLNFLAAVQKNAKALVIVRGCKLSPLPGQADAREALAQLGAECDMQWITINPAKDGK